ncbi:hypothetical protein PYW07_004230 [Mythimna separata]|uniref:Glucose-methanol-choline oxidoreductase N-terminal domain-containing protein n=1 Tax=Mythimna separata TaxID=271217 RepID=A0AAD8DXV6_MYTSE|nr:hypothetical protein PYW07_004230 [Mythimna separata]
MLVVCVCRSVAVLTACVLVWEAQAQLLSESLPASVVLRDGQRFDYIVVGAGAAGAAAAARLVLAGASVLLVEAGGNPTSLSEVPSAAMVLLGSELDWQYRTIPNNMSCLASVGQQCRFSRGRCLGGSSAINYMLYTRGNRRDFDDMPVPGWTWDDLLPYFLQYEGLQDLDLLPPSSIPYHNTTGTMRIGFFDASQNPWHSRLIKAYKSLGLPENPDVNAESQIGVSQLIGYVYDGLRMSTARGYLAREDVKRSLRIAKYTRCTGVIIDEGKIARGVTVVQGLKKLKILARKEVILSAGAIGTPQILMLSGIGPAEHLQSMGIRVKVDLPGVGANMTDHILPLVLALVDKGEGITDDLLWLATRVEQAAELVTSASGPLTSNGLTDVSAFLNSHCYDFERRKLLNESFDGSDCESPNLQLIHAYIDRNLVAVAKPVFMQATGFNNDVVEQISIANTQYAILVISPVLLYPYSVGHVRLASSDPLAYPAIFPNFMDDERDVDDLVRSIRIVEQMIDSPPFRKRNASILHLNFRGCPSVGADREGYWRCYSRHMTYTAYHAAGTASVGGVLDARLRVRGVRRLRVADLSALPRAPRANTAAVAIAVGERVADFVLQDTW